jgi:hypothetical protein
MSTEFAASWTFVNNIKDELNASSYDIKPVPGGKFRSGRPKLMAHFYARNKALITSRLGMELVSKRTGMPYQVFARKDTSATPPRTILRREQSSDYAAGEILEAIYRDAPGLNSGVA